MADKIKAELALKKAMSICASREMCFSDISAKLVSWGVEESDCNKILKRLGKEKFIDEERYARAFTLDRFRHNKWGKIKIRAALRIKKIPDEIITSALDSIDNEEYTETMRLLIKSHRRSARGKNDYEIKGKLLRYGLSKGFESNLLYDLLGESE
jgi:regulatory protein